MSPSYQETCDIWKLKKTLEKFRGRSWVAISGQSERNSVCLLQKLCRVSGQDVEDVHPGSWRRLEDVAPNKLVLPVDEILPGICLMQWIIPGHVQTMLFASFFQMNLPLQHSSLDLLVLLLLFHLFLLVALSRNDICEKFWLLSFLLPPVSWIDAWCQSCYFQWDGVLLQLDKGWDDWEEDKCGEGKYEQSGRPTWE